MSQEHIEKALAKYQPTDATIAAMADNYGALVVMGLDDRAGLKAVHDARMDVRGLRVQVEKTRKELKKDALEYGRAVDTEAKRITGMLTPIEEDLAEKESIVAKEKERLEAIAAEARKVALQARLDAIFAFGVIPNPLEVQEWTEEVYQHQLAEMEQAHKDFLEEQERLEADEAVAAQELAEKREQLRVEREAHEAAKELVLLQHEEERAKLDIERAAIRVAREAQEAKEAEAKRMLELEQARKEAVERAKRREEETEAAREAEEAELERLRPQYEKIHRYAQAVFDVPVPDVDCKQEIEARLSMFAYELGALAPTVKAEEVPE